MIVDNIAQMVLYFFLYSVIGWLCEVIYCSILDKKVVNRGFLFGPYCPIYGFGALIFVKLLLPLEAYPALLFLVGMLACTLLEYITSWGMERLFKLRWWDYSHYRFNLNGRICLLNSVLFGIMGLFLVYLIHPLCIKLVIHITSFEIEALSAIILVVMSIDFIFSVLTVSKLAQKIRLFDRHLAEIKQNLNHHFQEKFTITKDMTALLAHHRRDALSVGSLRLLDELQSANFNDKNLKKLLTISRVKDLQREHSPLMIIHDFLSAKIALAHKQDEQSTESTSEQGENK